MNIDDHINEMADKFREAIDKDVFDDVLKALAEDAIITANEDGSDIEDWILEYMAEQI